jgi:thiamine biosynthesis lipoprotein
MTALLTRDETAALPTVTWRDWSCLVRLVVGAPDALQPAAVQLQAIMGRVDRAVSRFRIDSELCWANANAGRPIAASRLLGRFVRVALDAAARTGGALDPTIGHELVLLGYDRDISLVTDPGRAPAARRPAAGWRDVRLDELTGLLTVPAGTALDLGATAKAQTADWAADELAARYGCPVLVEIGGDLAVAGPKSDWQISVGERAGRSQQQISLHAGGVATSTTTVRTWTAGGHPVHHIIDPATGLPSAGRWRTVSVAARTAVHANSCSTAAIVLGSAALPFLAGQGVAARLLDHDGHVTTVGGWPC